MRTWLVLSAILAAAALELIDAPALAQGSLFEQDMLTGDWGGARKQLVDAGVQFGVTDIAETLSNPVGGIRQLTIYDGLVTASLDLDLDKLVKWPDATFHVDGYQISGRGLSQNAIGNLLTVSGIEALASTRLHDLWLQQQFLDSKVSLRIGQIALDDEFYISEYSAIFINSTFGCPGILAADLPSGGPCYPFAVPGARVRVAPTTALSFSAAVFNGDPAPPGPGNPQVRNSSGTNFLVGEGGALAVAEFAYSFDVKPDLPNPLSDVKLGAWYDSGDFPNLRFDTTGVLAGEPEQQRHSGHQCRRLRSLSDPRQDAVAAPQGDEPGTWRLSAHWRSAGKPKPNRPRGGCRSDLQGLAARPPTRRLGCGGRLCPDWRRRPQLRIR